MKIPNFLNNNNNNRLNKFGIWTHKFEKKEKQTKEIVSQKGPAKQNRLVDLLLIIFD